MKDKFRRICAFAAAVLCTAAMTACNGNSAPEKNAETTLTESTDKAYADEAEPEEKQTNAQSAQTENESVNTTSAVTIVSAETVQTVAEVAQEKSDESVTAEAVNDDSVVIMNGSDISYGGKGASAKNGIFTITSAGTYVFSGELSDGQIVVDCSGKGTVYLVLDGASITCSDSAPIYIKNAEKTVVSLAQSSVNTLTDGSKHTDEDISAALFSKDDLVISGSGTLNVNGMFNDGISCNDTLKIISGSINVKSADDAIVANDYVSISGGAFTLEAGGDGIKAAGSDDETLGYVAVSEGSFSISAGADGIQAQTDILIEGGSFEITTGSGSKNGSWGSSSDSSSCKGLKAANNITIKEGTFDFNTADDSVHSNSAVTVSGGKIKISSADDGIHADTSLTITGGEISIAKSYEGIESAIITISGAVTDITASDDGINIAGGNDSSSLGGRPGQGNFSATGSDCLQIAGGTVTINADGDGIDSNGAIYMTGGTVYVNGPTNDGNGALDYDTEFLVSAGTLVCLGSSGMAQSPSASSEQSFVASNSVSGAAGSVVTVSDSSGNTLMTYTALKKFSSVVFSCGEIVSGSEYTVSVDGGSSVKVKAGEALSGGFGGNPPDNFGDTPPDNFGGGHGGFGKK